MDNMAAPTSRWFFRQVNLTGNRFFYTGVPLNQIFVTNKTTKNTVDETLAKNPYYGKYASKINSLQQQDPVKLAHNLEELSSQKKPKKISEVINSKPAADPKPKHESWSQYMQGRKKHLDAIMKTELIGDKCRAEIEQLWHEYFKDKYVISAVLPHKSYTSLHERAMEYPTFLFPLPRGDGYEFMVCQFAGDEAHFTSLINFQTHGENAPECLTLVYYTELADKDLVLMKGDYDKDILNGQEAEFLVNQVMLYFVQPTERKAKLLERFNKEPDVFQHMDLIQELENIQLG